MRHLVLAVVFVTAWLAGMAVSVWWGTKARCASCPEWQCMTTTHCGGSMSTGCWCMKQAHEQLGVCVSRAYVPPVSQ